MRIGVLGGSFDPPHTGHLALAKAAREHLQLDEVLFLPANQNPLKTRRSYANAKQRLAMVQRLVQGQPGLAVSDMEITRGGVSYTVDTIGELLMVQPADYWFLMGADALKALPQWKSPARLLRLCRLGVAVRPPVTESDVLARVPPDFRAKVDVVKMTPLDVSSTEIRARLAKGQNVSPWLAPEVLRYIGENGLYKE